MIKFLIKFVIFQLFICFLGIHALASKVSIPLFDKKFSQTPASDLFYKGKRIDEIDTLELKKRGFDISKLDPYTNNLWKDRKLLVSNQSSLNYPTNQILEFKGFKKSPSQIFRATFKTNENNRFTLTASIDNHTNILRATLLRLLGYDIDTPKYYKKLHLKFESKIQREKFIELIGEQTLTKRDKWVVKNIKNNELIVKGFIVSPAKLRNVTIHMPIMHKSRQQERRIFRALLEIYVLTDFPQAVNKIGWKVGRLFNKAIIFNHPYAKEFRNVTIDDLKWIHRKITKLSKDELKSAVEETLLPQDIQKLIVEKLSSRINSLTKIYQMQDDVKHFDENRNITFGNVKDGKLTKANYNGYVVSFHEEDPESPYRFSELFRLFKTQLTYASLSSALDYATSKLIPGISIEDAIRNVSEKITANRRHNSPSTQISAWSSPIANGRVFANRNIVFGQYLGSNAPMQLVDSIGAEVSLGLFTNITGLERFVARPGINSSVSIGRTYTHVRAMPDLMAASKQKVRNIFVPGLLKKLGRVIKDEFSCSIPKSAWVDESEFNGNKIYYIKYDHKRANGKKEAIQKRQELIESGVSASIILITKIDRDKECSQEVSKIRSKNMESFLKQFALNETFIINDNLKLGTRLNAPLPILTGTSGANITLSGDSSVALLKSVIIRRTSSGIEVTIQQQRNIKGSLEQGFNYFIELLRNSNEWVKGNLYSKVYKINLDNISKEDQSKALKALREVFVDNDHDFMRGNYFPIELSHRVKTHLKRWRLLWYKSEKLKLNHKVEVLVPQKEGQNFSKEQRTRTLYSSSYFKRKGSDYYNFADKVASSFSSLINLGSNDGDPGQAFLGNSRKKYFITEGELTKGRKLSAMSKVEFIFTGWKIKTTKLFPIFDQIESMYSGVSDNEIIDRGKFNASPALRSYDIRTTMIFYPDAIDKMQYAFYQLPEDQSIKILKYLFGSYNWSKYCVDAINFFGRDGPQSYYGDKYYECLPVPVHEILDLRKKGISKDRIQQIKDINRMMFLILDFFQVDKFLAWVGDEHFFATTRVTGFRENHHIGFLEYISDSIGTYNTIYGTGPYDEISSYFGLSPYELRALNYTPGM